MTKNISLILAGAALAFTTAAPSAQAFTVCQTACTTRYLSSFEALWQSSHPANVGMPDYRQQVLGVLNNLNTCLSACPVESSNVAVGQAATASLSSNGNAPAKAVDGSTSTYWWAKSTAAQWIQVDLGASFNLSKVTLAWSGNYATGYNVQVSSDGTTWNTVYTTTVGKGGSVEHAFTASARYVRINCTKANGKNGYAITELGIIGS